MAMLVCPECKNNVSDKAAFCPHCGCPIEYIKGNEVVKKNTSCPIDDFEIEYNILKKYIGNESNVVIPDCISTIGSHAFEDCDFIINIEIPISVTIIEEEAFKGCSYLDSIVIPDNVTYIGERAFKDCVGLNTIKLSSNLKRIDREAFENCSSIESIIIPNGVQEIAFGAFMSCRCLEKILIPDSVKIMGCNVIYDTEIYHNTNYWHSGMMYYGNILIGTSTYGNCETRKIKEGTRLVCESAFSSFHQLKNILIPDSVEDIGADTFSYCNRLEKVIIPNGVNSIGENAFIDCKNLTTIIIPNSVATIGEHAFHTFCWPSYHALKDLTILCEKNSYAHRYAISEGIKFEIISAEQMADEQQKNIMAIKESVIESQQNDNIKLCNPNAYDSRSDNSLNADIYDYDENGTPYSEKY